MINAKDIEKLAELARMGLGDPEKEKLLKDVESILGYIDQIKKADIKLETEDRLGVVKNVMREDRVTNTPEEYTDDLIREVPRKDKGYISVKKIIGSSDS